MIPRAALILMTPLGLLAAGVLQTCSATHEASAQPFVIPADGHPVPMIPFGAPVLTNAQVGDWLRVALVELWTYSHHDYDAHLLHVGGRLLTPSALASFRAANSDFVKVLTEIRGRASLVVLRMPLVLDRNSQEDRVIEWYFEVVGQWQISRRGAASQMFDMVLHVTASSDPADGYELRMTSIDLRSNVRRA